MAEDRHPLYTGGGRYSTEGPDCPWMQRSRRVLKDMKRWDAQRKPNREVALMGTRSRGQYFRKRREDAEAIGLLGGDIWTAWERDDVEDEIAIMKAEAEDARRENH